MYHHISHRHSGALHEVFSVFSLALALAATVAVALNTFSNRGGANLGELMAHSILVVPHRQGIRVHGTPGQRAAVRQALDQIDSPAVSAGLAVVVTSPGSLPPHVAGCYSVMDNRISLSSDIVDEPSQRSLVRVLAHEVGHMFDYLYLDDAARREYLSLRGFPAGTDWPGEGGDWASRPIEDFAEVYAVLATAPSQLPIATDAGRTGDPQRIKELIALHEPAAAGR